MVSLTNYVKIWSLADFEQGYLHLSFFTVKITLLRRLIRSTALEPLCVDLDILTHTRQLAHETAQAAISFVSSLRPDHLEAFWYFGQWTLNLAI